LWRAISFTRTDRASAHIWMAGTLRRFGYRNVSRSDKGVLRQYQALVTGLSRAQMASCASGRFRRMAMSVSSGWPRLIL